MSRGRRSGTGSSSGTAKENRPTQDTFHCTACDHQAHADTVGALNVLRAGLARRNAQPA
ncbi:zinc ribbon domain-containing protein [Streptomyces sp. NPDC002187]|uniref:zinc ribbon domain-containing protein n=1 Tax=Streptomyces sp. NPDC002187 TaxID=3364637 RepID=UPI0036A44EEF